MRLTKKIAGMGIQNSLQRDSAKVPLSATMVRIMDDIQFSIRLDLTGGARIGPGEIALLEAIRAKGSITGAARHLGRSYRWAWLVVNGLNGVLFEPAVTAASGGPRGGQALLTAVGERLVEHYHAIEEIARSSAVTQFCAIDRLVRRG
jgi:molybdate transport system regulatory protein